MRFAFISLGVILASRSTARIRLKFYWNCHFHSVRQHSAEQASLWPFNWP